MNSEFMQELFGARGVRVAILGVLSFLSLFLIAQTIGTVKSFDASYPAETITVSGDGQATMAPDVARVSYTVEHTAPTVADAQAQTTKQANAVLEYVKGQGVTEKDIKTLAYSITPQYAYPNPCAPGMLCPAYSTPKVTGYQVSQSVQVTVRDLTKVGEILGGLGKLAVQNVSGPAFALDDSTAGYSAARADAISKAKVQAALVANALGVRLGKIVSFNENSGGGAYPMEFGMGGDATISKVAATPSVPAGENTYNASVSITYEIR